jgi:nucleolar protein 56
MEISECFIGVFAFDESGREVMRKLFPRQARESRLEQLQRGEPTEEHLELVQELATLGFKNFTVESEELARALKEKTGLDFKVKFPNHAGQALRKLLPSLCSAEELWELARLLATKRVKSEASRKEESIILGVKFLENLDKSLNTLYSVLLEWYAPHFPELLKLNLEPKENLTILSLGSIENLTPQKLREAGLSEPLVQKVITAVKKSIGAELPPPTLKVIRKSAEGLLSFWKLRDEIESHLDELMSEVAPNLKALAGGILGAKLISKAGGLEELSKMTAGHVQILGAEKSFFRALKTRGKRPKHGIIYLHPKLRGAPRKLRGKIARTLAAKLVIAARVDATSGRYLGEELKEKLEERLKKIYERA